MVVIVDDDELDSGFTRRADEGGRAPCVDVRICGRIPNLWRRERTACLIVDIRMPGMSGLELQAKLNEAHQRIPIIFITASG